MQNPENFNVFYNQTIQPELQRLDLQRQRLVRTLVFSILASFGLVFLDMYIGTFVLTMIVSIPVVLYFTYLYRRIKAFNLDFKPKVVRLILDFIDDGLLFGELLYHPKGAIPLQTFLDSGIFITRPAEYRAEDYIEGRIGDIEFEMCELNVQEYSRVRARLDVVFRGIFIKAKFVHPPKGALLVLPRVSIPKLSQTMKNFVAAGGQMMDKFISHPEFLKVYTVYGSRDTKLNDLLPLELMNFMLQYRSHSGPVSLAFHGNHIYAAIPNEKDILEPRFFQSNVSYDLVREFYDDIYIAMNLVIEFDKNH